MSQRNTWHGGNGCNVKMWRLAAFHNTAGSHHLGNRPANSLLIPGRGIGFPAIVAMRNIVAYWRDVLALGVIRRNDGGRISMPRSKTSYPILAGMPIDLPA